MNPLTLIPSLILASRSKPIMVLKADAWFHDFRRTAIRNLNGGAFLGRWQSSWSDTRGIAFMSDTMSRVSVIWMWPERRWNATQWNVSIRPRILTPIHITLPVTGKVWAKWSLFCSSDVQNPANLLESKDGPVAQKDRAAVS